MTYTPLTCFNFLVVKKLRLGQPILELIHLDGIPRTDFLVQPVFGLRADELQLKAFRYRIRRDGLAVAVVEPVGILVKNLAGFLVLVDLGEIVAVAHLAADAFVVIDEHTVRFETAARQFFIKQIDAIVHRAMGFADRRAGAARAVFIHHCQQSRSFALFSPQPFACVLAFMNCPLINP